MRKTAVILLTLIVIICAVTSAKNDKEDAVALICKYCGREVRSSSGGKLTWQGSDVCKTSPGKKHVLMPVPGHCVYCGREVKTSSSGILAWQGSTACSASPSKKHQLQD